MWVTPSGSLFYLFELPPRVIISQFSWTVEDGQRTVEIPMDLHPDPDVMATITICGDLECHSLEADAVVGADRSLVLLTEDVIKIFPRPGNER